MIWLDYFLQLFVQALAILTALGVVVLVFGVAGWRVFGLLSWAIGRRRRRVRDRGRRGWFGGLI